MLDWFFHLRDFVGDVYRPRRWATGHDVQTRLPHPRAKSSLRITLVVLVTLFVGICLLVPTGVLRLGAAVLALLLMVYWALREFSTATFLWIRLPTWWFFGLALVTVGVLKLPALARALLWWTTLGLMLILVFKAITFYFPLRRRRVLRQWADLTGDAAAAPAMCVQCMTRFSPQYEQGRLQCHRHTGFFDMVAGKFTCCGVSPHIRVFDRRAQHAERLCHGRHSRMHAL